MKTYVISDIHGCLDLLNKALGDIAFRDSGGTVVFTGDYVDRGPDSAKVISTLMVGPPDGWEWVFIRGNHEEMLMECWNNDGLDGEWWRSHGGTETMESYGDGPIPLDHLRWISNLKQCHDDEHRVYTHAAVHEQYTLADQPNSVTQWMRYTPRNANVGYRHKHVVHGHTIEEDGPMLYGNRTNLDIGAYRTGKLAVGVFDDEIPGGPIEVLMITA